MKTIKIRTLLAVFLVITPFSHAIDVESLDSPLLIDRLLTYTEPGAPEVFEDMVIFTASSGLRRVGVAFADEGFAKVHWFRQLMIARDIQESVGNPKNFNPYKDSGITFHVYQVPEGVTEVAYRMVINGLWTTDPVNPDTRYDGKTGLSWSVISIPAREIVHNPLKGPPGSLSFVFKGPPGETVSVAGDFNGWDPFMYELREGPAGNYSINIPLPPGTYQYVFFHRGQRYLDPYNGKRVYTKDGRTASEIMIQ
nr:hypothetical protein [uncultured bacterium]